MASDDEATGSSKNGGAKPSARERAAPQLAIRTLKACEMNVRSTDGLRPKSGTKPSTASARPVVDIVPLTIELGADLERLFRRDGGPYGAWGMYWRMQLSCLLQSRLKSSDHRYFLRKYLASQDRPFGLLAYVDERPVGWIDAGPRRVFPKFNHARASRVPAEIDLDKTWAVPSIYVAPRFKALGLANNLIDAACAYAHRRGATAIDAAPWDTSQPIARDAAAAGLAIDYRRQGFREIAVRSSFRPLMRRQLSRIIRPL